jgi:hypothetical protein
MTTRLDRLLAITLTVAISSLMFSGLSRDAYASPKKQKPKIVKTVPDEPDPFTPVPRTGDSPTGKQYSPEQLEELRSKLLELVDTVKEFSDLLLPEKSDLANQLEQARKEFEQYSPQQLNLFRAAINPAEMNTRLGEARAALEEFRPVLEPIRQAKLRASKLQQSSSANMQIESAGLPDRADADSVCSALIGPGAPSSALIISLDAVYLVAAGVRAGLSRGCNQVLVALGEGGNSSLACIAADVVFYAAQAVRNKVAACETDYTRRTVDANFDRLGHIHADLESSIANDNTNTTAIITNANANKGDVITNANSNTTTITTAISNAQTTIVNNANANATMLRDLILRTQIEADLASTDGSAFVALYLTPGAKGGYLELVRSIVVQTIANIGGTNTGQANALLTKGDAYKTAGDYRSAYASYRLAYKKAQGL